MSTLLILLVVFCSNGPENSFMTEASKSVNALVALLNLTDVTCGSIEWCTIQTVGPRSDMKGSSCCPPCSCEKQCYDDGSCCPDINLSQHLNGTVFSNITQLVSQISEIVSLNDIDVSVSQSVIPQGHIDIKCIRSSVLPARSKFSPKVPTYIMVGTCQNGSASAYEKEKCRKEPSMASELQLEDVRPVQSIQSGVVYRNIHCFECSSESGHFAEEWDVYIVDAIFLNSRFNVFDQPYPDIITYLLQETSSTNIVFLPSTVLSQYHPPTVCVNIDVETCAEMKPNNYDSMKDACQMFSLPVHTKTKTGTAVFNNLACIHCSGIDTMDKGGVCSSYIYWTLPPFLWKLRNEFLKSVGPNDTYAANYADKTISAFSSSRCDIGFVYDHVKKLCRQIHCPCGMMAYNSTCIPTFPGIPGKYYEVFFSVIGARRLHTEQADEQYDEAIMAFFQHHFDSQEDIDLASVALGLWKPYSEVTERDDIVHVIFEVQASSINYNAVLKTIRQLSKVTKITTFAKHFYVSISVVDVIRSSRDVIVPKMKNTYKIVNANIWGDLNIPSNKVIKIKSCQFCYLVELLQDEIEIKNGGAYYIPRTKTYGSLHSIATIKDTDLWLICANEVIEHVQDSETINRLDSGCCSGIADSTENTLYGSSQTVSDRDAVILITAIMAVVLLLSLIVARRVKKKIRRTTTSNVNTNSADGIEMANVNQE